MTRALRRLGVIVVWVLAAVGTASLTYAAVSQAGNVVGGQPAVPVAGADIAARLVTTTSQPAAETTVGPVTTTTAPTAPTTPTTSPPTTIAVVSTTAASTTRWKTVSGVGTVSVTVSGDHLSLASASPQAPYLVDIESSGPEQVDVRFESETMEWRVRAEVDDGVVVWEVTSSVEEEDDESDDGD